MILQAFFILEFKAIIERAISNLSGNHIQVPREEKKSNLCNLDWKN